MAIKIRLAILSLLEFAVWGAYLTSMGTYLASVGMASHIGWFYSIQGFVSLFMPALMGMVADRWIPAQRLLALCHFIAGLFMVSVSVYAFSATGPLAFSSLFSLYAFSVAFFMPTIALTNSVAYSALDKARLDTVKAFPPIRLFGTVGFIISMWIVDLGHMQASPMQFAWSAILSFVMAVYALSLPDCPVCKRRGKGLVNALGWNAFSLFKNYKMALFFIFSMLIGVCLQITNCYANPFITSFKKIEEYSGTFGVEHANILISLSQMSEALCILLIPFCLSRLGIKKVILIALLAWVLRFGLFAIGNPGNGVWLLLLSMIVYGVAFDFFNISGSIFVDKETDIGIRHSAQGLFMMMTSGFGATVGTLSAQAIVNRNVYCLPEGSSGQEIMAGWQNCWSIFALYAFTVAVLFTLLFRYKHTVVKK